MPHTIREKTALLARIRRIKGQAEAIEKALAQEAEASSVLQQIAAIRGATNGLMSEVLEGHLREHVVAAASAQEREREVEAIVRIRWSHPEGRPHSHATAQTVFAGGRWTDRTDHSERYSPTMRSAACAIVARALRLMLEAAEPNAYCLANRTPGKNICAA